MKNKNEWIKWGAITFVAAGTGLLLGVWMTLFGADLAANNKVVQKLGLVRPTPTPLPEPTVEYLQSVVTPESGYEVKLVWGETGKKLVEAGGIDMGKYGDNYSAAKWQEWLRYLTENKNDGITINKDNAYFWVNTLWALGLTQESKVLSEGVMGTEYADNLGGFASTGGWTLGSKPAVELFSSSKIIDLDEAEQARVEKISAGIYRPCCGNPTSFPDCNHGMAILGLVELMVDQGFSDEEIYEAALAFNSYWFPQTYMDLAYYFQTEENTLWQDVDAERVLNAEFSSAPGYQNIKQQIGNIPGSPVQGGSCGA